jgi:hypothetical protein
VRQPAAVGGDAQTDPVDPGPKRRAPLEARELAVNRNEDVLTDIDTWEAIVHDLPPVVSVEVQAL